MSFRWQMLLRETCQARRETFQIEAADFLDSLEGSLSKRYDRTQGHKFKEIPGSSPCLHPISDIFMSARRSYDFDGGEFEQMLGEVSRARFAGLILIGDKNDL
jgi:hypothetical protein